MIVQQALPCLTASAGPPLLAFSQLLEPGFAPRREAYWRRLGSRVQCWCEEGGEWPGGLQRVLEHWLRSGHSLAFPETAASARRDRREMTPSALLLSPLRRQQVMDEIDSRLPTAGSWRRRLYEWARARCGLPPAKAAAPGPRWPR